MPHTDQERHGARLTAASRRHGRHPDPVAAASAWVEVVTAAEYGAGYDPGLRFMGEASALFVERACADAYARNGELSTRAQPTEMIEACR